MRGSLLLEHLFLGCLAAAFFIAPSVAARADTGRVTRTAAAVDPVTLQGQGMTIRLWGIRPVMSPVLELKALDLMDRLIGGAPVTCQEVGGTPVYTVARCAAADGEDIGLALLGRGYVVLDRRQDVGSVPAYMEAERSARHNAAGIWRQVVSRGKGMSQGLRAFLDVLPAGAVLLMVLVMHFRLKGLETQQREEYAQSRDKEDRLTARERHVLASTLEGELRGNKNRIEAFLTIYGEMLESLKSTTETPKYKQAGDIVQKHPSLSKAVFEASVGKLSLLDMKLAARLSKLYAALPAEQEYINIAPDVPLESAVALVEKVIRDAEALRPPLTEAIAALENAMGNSRTEIAA
ncbi:MAG: hypothetical protein KGL10_01025 [Alphaproteobacteria bacterium]|nr:hypothetical protein [Alphaproteobacteria bacterium]MDE2335873.1 hypothetical protein [Alphaproteobacteria bacterium]